MWVAFQLLQLFIEYILGSKSNLLRCIRENLAVIRHDISPKYADCINNELLINYYVDKYSNNHGPGSSLDEDAKKSIAKHMSGMEHVTKKIQEPWVQDILW